MGEIVLMLGLAFGWFGRKWVVEGKTEANGYRLRYGQKVKGIHTLLLAKSDSSPKCREHDFSESSPAQMYYCRYCSTIQVVEGESRDTRDRRGSAG